MHSDKLWCDILQIVDAQLAGRCLTPTAARRGKTPPYENDGRLNLSSFLGVTLYFMKALKRKRLCLCKGNADLHWNPLIQWID